jgi:hypothetical protein
MPTLSSVIILAFEPFAPGSSTLRLKGYAMPPFVGRVLEPSVAGMSVAGDWGLSETTMPGGENVSPVGDGSGEA